MAGQLDRLKGIKTVTVNDFDALVHHWTAWDRLGWESPQNSPYSLPGFVDAALRHGLRSNERWFCSFAYAGDRLIGVMPVVVVPHPVLGRRYPIIRTFSPHMKTGEPLLAPDQAAVALQALLAEIRHQEPRHLIIDLKAVRSSSPFWAVVYGAIDGYILWRGLEERLAYLNVQGEFEDYFASLGKLRRELGRCRRRLEKQGPVLIEIKRDGEAKADFLDQFIALEASGWKGRRGTAIANNPRSVNFYSGLVKNFAAQGRLEWHILRVGERLIAAQLGLRCGGGLMIPRVAYDEHFALCSPGNLLNVEVLKDAFSRPELVEINDMSDLDWQKPWRMDYDRYINGHLLRRGITPILLKVPSISARYAYQNYVRPHIPAKIRSKWRQLRSGPQGFRHKEHT